MLNQTVNPNPRKSPGLAAVLSFFISGLGQIYNGQILKGLITLVVQVINALLTFVVIGYVTGGIIWIWGIYDAFKTAQKINARLNTPVGGGGGMAA